VRGPGNALLNNELETKAAFAMLEKPQTIIHSLNPWTYTERNGIFR